ncbi:MAG: hypothetical protein O9264_12415 [Leptospira sp.]|nr:hypothetical protein [Leptospira sp.]
MSSQSYYEYLKGRNAYSPEMCECIGSTVRKLLEHNTNAEKPGMLLGKVQSGKTRAFLGVMGLAFDKGYDISIVLTKGTKALAKQTLQRIRDEFEPFIEDDALQVYDIMQVPAQLTKYQMNKKLVFIVKKEDDNIRKLSSLFFEIYPDLGKRQILIIDDEADLASIGFTNSRQFGLNINKIAKQISDFRSILSNDCDFLQVTATPYSLYLQPDEIQVNDEVFRPVRPAFTILVPIHADYVGGKEYFEDSIDDTSLFSYVWYEITDPEREVLSTRDRRFLNNVLTSPKLQAFRMSFVIFLLGGAIRRWQSIQADKRPRKYSFLLHTETSRDLHSWQVELADELRIKLTEAARNDSDGFNNVFNEAYKNLIPSLEKNGLPLPSESVAKQELIKTLDNEEIGVIRVNSDNDINTLLDSNGQLMLDNPYTIFIGGQILDRGITIENLIGFFYGRSPGRFQMDTVLQHSRMYGARPLEDIAVTRLYTTSRIYGAMQRMQEIDSALRLGFEEGRFDDGVVFIHSDPQGEVKPCSPNKILLSETVTLKPNSRILPIEFTTTNVSEVREARNKIESFLRIIFSGNETENPVEISVATAKEILSVTTDQYVFNEGFQWDVTAITSALQYIIDSNESTKASQKMYFILRRNRNVQTHISWDGGQFNRKPEGTAKTEEGGIAARLRSSGPVLILLEQRGEKEKGWKGEPFFWPVIYTPGKMRPMIYSEEKGSV